MKKKFCLAPCFQLHLMVVLGLLCGQASAANTITWANNPASTNWSASASWTGGVVPGTGDLASIPKGGTRPWVVAGETNSVNGVLLFSKDSNFCSVNGTGTLRLGPGGLTITVESGSGGTSGILKPVLLLDTNQTWSVGGAGNHAFTFDGRIGEVSGPRSLVAGGTGVMILNSPDSDFSGGFSRTAGNLRLGASTTLDGNGDVQKGPVGKGVLKLSNVSVTDTNKRTLYNPLVLEGRVTFGRDGQSSGYTITFAPSTGTVPTSAQISAAVNGTQHTLVLFNDRQNPTISQALGESGAAGLGLIVTNGVGTGSSTTGRLTLSGTSPNTFTGVVSVQGANLRLAKSAGVAAISGDVEVLGGTLQINAGEQIADTAKLSIAGSGTLSFSAATTETVRQLWVNGEQWEDATYTSANAAFITGSGSLVVTEGLTLPTVIVVR